MGDRLEKSTPGNERICPFEADSFGFMPIEDKLRLGSEVNRLSDHFFVEFYGWQFRWTFQVR